MPQPMQQQTAVVRHVLYRHGEPVASATIAGRTYTVGDALAEIAETMRGLSDADFDQVEFVLSEEAWERFQEDLRNPPKPTPELIELFRSAPPWAIGNEDPR